ncbi:ATP-binding cassette sub- A member 1 [Blyttiomyces sp. JEL0837]|nr:ATP-binding cassette sub- A member 1 [Blyttiomyces sp. JEL0837]
MAPRENEVQVELNDFNSPKYSNVADSGNVSKRLPSLGRNGSQITENFFLSFWDQLVIMMRRNTTLQFKAIIVLSEELIFITVYVIKPQPSLKLYLPLSSSILSSTSSNRQTISINALATTTRPLERWMESNLVRDTEAQTAFLMFYYPQTAEYTAYMQNVAETNAQRTGNTAFTVAKSILSDPTWKPSSSDASTIYPVSSQDYIYNYAVNNPNVTRWAVTFDTQKLSASALTNVRYQVWYNATLTANSSDIFGRELISVVRGLDEAILTSLNGKGKRANLDYQVKDWPLIPAVTLSDEIVQSLGPCFFFCSVMVIFISVLNQIVGENEAKLRHGMEMMVLVNALATSVLGIAFQFSAFKNTNFMVLWITFCLFGESMLMFGYFLTTFVRQARVAVLLGIFIFIIGLLFESFVFSSSYLGYLWWNPQIIPDIGWKCLILIPFFNFGHMFLDISTYTTGRKDSLTDTFIPGPGFHWETLFQTLPSNLAPVYSSGTAYLPTPVQAWYFMLMNIGIFGVLLWYFDAVVPDEYGTRQPFCFPLLPSYWGLKNTTKQAEKEWLRRIKSERSLPVTSDEDYEVSVERQNALGNLTESVPVRIINLNKTYQKYFFSNSKLDKVAVRNTCLTLQEGKLLALLGQNGAGKSTTMSILAGLTPATSGDALIYGSSVRSQMSLIRKYLGVCPQHDILFDDLTAKEHIELYAGLKGVSPQYWGELFEERLKAVKLWTVKNVRAGTYSGG